ncbi:MAG: YggS family pyridoxal phosphate-dependent enzyme [Terriglobia bacterium]
MGTDVRANVQKIQGMVEEAAIKAGRNPAAVKLMAVSKTIEPKLICEALEAGIQHIGENRVQEAQMKLPQLCAYPFTFHLIGALQKNKVNKAVELFDWIHTVESLELATKISRAAELSGKRVPVLIEVNQGREPSKSGVLEENLKELVEQISLLKHLSLRGLMSVPPYLEDPEAVRPYFARLREFAEKLAVLKIENVSMEELSMGMSHDFPIAIEEGATLVRVGTAIFGPRA